MIIKKAAVVLFLLLSFQLVYAECFDDTDCSPGWHCYSGRQDPGLFAYLKLDSGTLDSSPWQNHAVPVNASPETFGCAVNGCYLFSDLNPHSYLTIRKSNPYSVDELDFYNKQSISIGAWVKPSNSLSDLGPRWDSYIMFKPKNTILLGWSGWSHDGYECNIWHLSNASRKVSVWKKKAQVAGRWVHIGCSFNGTFLGLYINGTLQAYNDSIPNYRLQSDPLGKEYYSWFIATKNQYSRDSANLTWEGWIDEPFILNRSLGKNEWLQVYQDSRSLLGMSSCQDGAEHSKCDSVDSDCDPGLYCYDKAQACFDGSLGDPCESSSQCKSGFCKSNICVKNKRHR
jgi:hypothetical protein